MSKSIEDFFKVMLDFFPLLNNDYKMSIYEHGQLLKTVVIEDIFMPEIIKLLQENKETELLKNIFEYFEEVVNCEDEDLINTFSVTVLEILGNDKDILETSRCYMGPQTIQLQIEADRALGRC